MDTRVGQPVETLRRLLGAPSVLVMPTVHDPVSAWVSEMAGFESVLLSRLAVGISLTATDDTSLVDDETMIQRTAEVCRLVSIPVLVDLTPVRGTASKLRQTTSSLALAGAAGLVVDDGDGDSGRPGQDLQSRLDAVGESLKLRRLDLVTAARIRAIVSGETDAFGVHARLQALAPAPELIIVEGLRGQQAAAWKADTQLAFVHVDANRVGDDSRARRAERDGFRAFTWEQPLISAAVAAMRESLEPGDQSTTPSPAPMVHVETDEVGSTYPRAHDRQ